MNEFSSEVVGFESKNASGERQVQVKDSGCDAMESSLEFSDKCQSSKETADIGIQASPPLVVCSNSNEETDKKLAAWLKKILPQVERELVEGITPVYNSSKSEERILKVEHYQDIEVKHLFTDAKENGMGKGAAATWLSVHTQDSPLLVVSISSSCKSDEQRTSFIVTYEPRRSKADAKIYWHELIFIPVKAPIEFLETNQQNRDMFAGASKTGDLYIWSYHNNPGESPLSEIFSKVSEDSIVGLSFLSNNRLLCCLSDGKIIVYKINSNQSTIIDKIMKIEPRNVKDPEITCISSLSETEDDFVLGLFNGSLLHCSTNQLMPQDGSFNPIVRELQGHKFAIASLKHCNYQGKSFTVSCDLSGEIFFHEIDDTSQPKLVIKLPLPLKSKITCTNDMNHIVCLEKGSLEVFRTSSKIRESVVEGNFEGTANVIELSRNESWLIAGVYNETFKIYHLIKN